MSQNRFFVAQPSFADVCCELNQRMSLRRCPMQKQFGPEVELEMIPKRCPNLFLRVVRCRTAWQDARWMSKQTSTERYSQRARLAMFCSRLLVLVQAYLMAEENNQSIMCGRLSPTAISPPPIRVLLQVRQCGRRRGTLRYQRKAPENNTRKHFCRYP